ncbi:fibronectin type III domain-containing protein [Plebeiibacterium sediminum]|uniref:Fibronectin type III domain-containing protein n=1 Tax=Plebeiibacterium sediminum TaxID=2992112 RepID=A0AAE3M692_9BACT|nr:fibronectin type III domain-containing protein [Plebeiobacterium sediminum]MCW3787554.1 fibronectin type III domain-containing protein [Plebeiobacterium sediminum]
MKKIILLFTITISLLATACSDDDDNTKEIIISEVTSGNFSATISFSEISGALAYDIELATNDDDYEYIESTENLTYEIKNLLAGTTYKIKVSAFSSTGKVIGEGEYTITTVTSIPELVGVWENFVNNISYSYSFNEDGTGLYNYGQTQMKIKWFAEAPAIGETSEITIMFYANEYTGSYTTSTYTYAYYGADEAMTIDGIVYFPE